MVFEWDGEMGTGVALTAGAAILGADTLVTRVEADSMVLGMVVDSDGDPPSFIGPGKDLDIGKAEIRCAVGASKNMTTALVFVDGRIDLADSMCILRFLFQAGSFPPPPGPGFDMTIQEVPQGPDPTEDKLGCDGGGEC